MGFVCLLVHKFPLGEERLTALDLLKHLLCQHQLLGDFLRAKFLLFPIIQHLAADLWKEGHGERRQEGEVMGSLTVTSLKTWTTRATGRADPKTETETRCKDSVVVVMLWILVSALEFIIYSRERLNQRKSLFAFHLATSEQEWN